jgi:hypothetical protein
MHWPFEQVPFNAEFSKQPLQLSVLYMQLVLVPSHVPLQTGWIGSLLQTLGPYFEVWPPGGPAGAGVHSPGVASQRWQGLLQAESQQKPSAQWVDVQSPSTAQL